jgi:predicted transcriptional regulator
LLNAWWDDVIHSHHPYFLLPIMTLTVRLDNTLEAALERYCAERGVTKSLVVQESLAAYLVSVDRRTSPAHAEHARRAPVSANYRAFADAGLIGAVALGQGADKAAVRAKVAESFARRKARRGGA